MQGKEEKEQALPADDSDLFLLPDASLPRLDQNVTLAAISGPREGGFHCHTDHVNLMFVRGCETKPEVLQHASVLAKVATFSAQLLPILHYRCFLVCPDFKLMLDQKYSDARCREILATSLAERSQERPELENRKWAQVKKAYDEDVEEQRRFEETRRVPEHQPQQPRAVINSKEGYIQHVPIMEIAEERVKRSKMEASTAAVKDQEPERETDADADADRMKTRARLEELKAVTRATPYGSAAAAASQEWRIPSVVRDSMQNVVVLQIIQARDNPDELLVCIQGYFASETDACEYIRQFQATNSRAAEVSELYLWPVCERKDPRGRSQRIVYAHDGAQADEFRKGRSAQTKEIEQSIQCCMKFIEQEEGKRAAAAQSSTPSIAITNNGSDVGHSPGANALGPSVSEHDKTEGKQSVAPVALHAAPRISSVTPGFRLVPRPALWMNGIRREVPSQQTTVQG